MLLDEQEAADFSLLFDLRSWKWSVEELRPRGSDRLPTARPP